MTNSGEFSSDMSSSSEDMSNSDIAAGEIVEDIIVDNSTSLYPFHHDPQSSFIYHTNKQRVGSIVVRINDIDIMHTQNRRN